MKPDELDRLYAFAGTPEVLRVVVDDDVADRFTVASRKLEEYLGTVADEEPWFSCLAPIRSTRWLLHAIPLPTDHPALGLEQLLARSQVAEGLASGSSDELRHWVNETLIAQRELLDTPAVAVPDAMMEMLADSSDPVAVIVIKVAALTGAVTNYYARSQVPFAAAVTPAGLRIEAPRDSIFVVGPSRQYPDWIFTAPRAEHVTVVLRASARDRDRIQSRMPVGGLPEIHVSGQRPRGLTTATFDIEPPPVNWALLRPEEPSAGHAEAVRARSFLLAANHTVLLEAEGSSVYTVTPTARAGDLIDRTPSSVVDVGDFLLLRKEFGAEDVIVQLANRILGKRAVPLRNLQERWKSALRTAVTRDGVAAAEQRLHDLGCEASNLGRWLSPDGIRTQRRSDFRAICEYASLPAHQWDILWQAMGEILSAHIKAGHEMRELLEAQLQQVDLGPLHETGVCEINLEDLDAGALVIYRVEARDPQTVMVHPRRLRVVAKVPVY